MLLNAFLPGDLIRKLCNFPEIMRPERRAAAPSPLWHLWYDAIAAVLALARSESAFRFRGIRKHWIFVLSHFLDASRIPFA
jgi:hypothetical protein